MMRNLFLLGLAATLLAACAPSPLYVGQPYKRGTSGEIPRDGTGEPLWDAIPPAVPAPTPRIVPPAPGIPITPY
jgi:hypothetical protein